MTEKISTLGIEIETLVRFGALRLSARPRAMQLASDGIAAIARLNADFRGRVRIFLKNDRQTRVAFEAWRRGNGFSDATKVHHDSFVFCRSRFSRAIACGDLDITHYVGASKGTLSILPPSIKRYHLLSGNPQLDSAMALVGGCINAVSWPSLVTMISV